MIGDTIAMVIAFILVTGALVIPACVLWRMMCDSMDDAEMEADEW